MKNREMALGDILPSVDARRPAPLLGWLRRALRILRTVIGAPDYDRYVSHMSAHHPGCELITRDDFMKQRLESRYSKPGSRCC